MKKLLTILGMVLLAVGFITVGESTAQQAIILISPSDSAQLTVDGATCAVTLEYEFNDFGFYSLESYEIMVDNDSDFSSPHEAIIYMGESSAYVLGLSPIVTYYWKILATYSSSMSPNNFYIPSDTLTFRFIVPELISPADGATDLFQSTPSILLDWETVWGGGISNVGYRLWVDDNSDFSSPEIDVGTNGSSYSPDLDYFTKYYWKVRCYSVSGSIPFTTTYYDWSTTWDFTTGCDIPTAPTLSSPDNGATVAQPVSMIWSEPDFADKYNIQIATNTGFDPLYLTHEVDSPGYSVFIDDGTTFYWRVRAGNECGWSDFTTYRTFTTVCPKPDIPVLTFPSDGATDMSMPFTLDWEDVATANAYRFIVDNNSDFSSPEIDEILFSSTDYAVVSDLSDGVTYYWIVQARNLCGLGEWSASRSFTMECPVPDPPILQLPADGVTNMSQPVSLDWADTDGATKYHLQVGDDPGFGPGSLIFNASAMVSSHSSISGMNDATKYYWRVASGNDCGYSDFTATRDFTTECPLPSTPVLTFPSDGAIDLSMPFTLDWGDVATADEYQFVVDDNSNFTSPEIYETPSSSDYTVVSGLSEGVTYYWHVQAHNSCGWGVWSASSSFTMECPIPAAPSLTSPGDGATVTQPVLLTWSEIGIADEYHIQIDTKTNFGSTIVNVRVVSASYSASGLEPGTTYYWRVRAGNECGWRSFIGYRTFTTACPEPDPPALELPEDGVTDVSQPVTWDWSDVSGASKYHIQVDDDPAFGSLVVDNSNRIASYFTWEGLEDGTLYYWRVSSINDCGESDWSDVRNFTTECDIPTIPTLLSPDDLAENQSQPVALSWSAVDIATKYHFQLANNVDFLPAIKDNLVTATTYNITGLEPAAKYYWRVRAGNDCDWGEFTAIRSFTTECPEPAPPGLIFPSDGATDLSMPFTLDWDDVADADFYVLEVDDDPDISSPSIDREPTSSEYLISSGLAGNVTYYWRVIAHSDCGYGVASDIRSFTTECPTLATPTLVLPSDGAVGLQQPTILEWNTPFGASKYHLQVDDNADFGSPEISYSGDDPDSEYFVSGLIEDGRAYYWRVKVGNNCDNWSDWSGVWNFSTECVTAAAPPLVSPANGATGIDIREPILFDWSDIAGNTGYRLQVKDDPGFESPLFVNTPAGVSEYSLATKLVSGTTYYWRVRTKNACGEGAWSSVRTFTPECPAVDTPMLQSPSNGALSIAQPVELDWSDVGEATNYHVQVGSDVAFGYPLIADDEDVASSAYTLPNLTDDSNFYWRIRAYNGCQWSDWSTVWTFATREQTDVEISDNGQIPEDFLLKQNYPNPFNPATTIEFALPRAAYVTLDIHNILGEKVETLVSRPMSAGSYSVTWDASSAPSGIYFYKIIAGTFSETKKMTLVK